jgi:co-chaperonin GroES (HSP10)
MKALNDQVIVEEIKEETKMIGAIEIPPSINPHEKLAKGRVVSVGNGRTTSLGVNIPVSVSEDNIIVFNSRCPKFKHEGREYFLVNESLIIATLED